MKKWITAMCFGAVVLGVCYVARQKSNKYSEIVKEFNNRMDEAKGNNILFGRIGSQEIGLAMNGDEISENRNVLVIGRAGTGKSYHYMLSNLLNSNASSVMVDPSGHFQEQYEAELREKGYDIYSFDTACSLSVAEHYDTELGKAVQSIGEKKGVIFLHDYPFLEKEESFPLKDINDYISNIFSQLNCSTSRKLHINFWLDELPNIGKIFNLNTMLFSAWVYNISFHLMLQDFSQLKKIYGEETADIISNCGTLLFNGSVSEKDKVKIKNLFDVTLTEQEIRKLATSNKVIVSVSGLPYVVCDKLNPEEYR